MSFSDLGLLPELLRAVADKGYDVPSAIQAAGDSRGARRPRRARRRANRHRQDGRLRAADSAAAHRRCARSNSRAPRALVLTPTRELAAQVAQSARDYGKYVPLRVTQVFGGVNINPQISALRSGCDILVATPGRLLDLAQQRAVDLSQVSGAGARRSRSDARHGFHPRHPAHHQTAAARSARTCCSRRPIPTTSAALAERLLHDPLSIQVAPRNAPIELVEQCAYRVPKEQKRHLLVHLIQGGQLASGADLHAHQARRQSPHAAARGRGHPRRGNPRQQEPGRARQGARHVQARTRSTAWWRPRSPPAASTSRSCRRW